jgi:hypothetical protein
MSIKILTELRIGALTLTNQVGVQFFFTKKYSFVEYIENNTNSMLLKLKMNKQNSYKSDKNKVNGT